MSILGRGWSFPPRFDSRQRAVMVDEESDIDESLRILFRTRQGERVMQHAYGTRLHQMVFEAASEQTFTEVADMVKKAVLFFEPRVEIERVEARRSEQDMGRLDVLLSYRIRSINTRHNLVYPLYLDQASQPVQAG